MDPTADQKRYASGSRFFIYAPPILGRKTKDGTLISKRRLPNPPFVGAALWQNSVYYYWWEYLRRHPGYKETCAKAGKGRYAKLYADFGDVHANDNFWQWWTAHQHLFCEPQGRTIQECLLNTHFADDQLVIAVPLEVRTVHLVRMFRKLLQANADRVQKARAKSRALYPVFAKPILSALHTSLVVWDLRQQNPKAKLHELFDLAAHSTTISVDQRVIVKGDDGDKPYVIHLQRAEREAAQTGVVDVFLREVRVVVRRRKAQTIKRHLRTAQTYIDNVVLGQFPKK